jgi:hypothetical protein
MKKGMSEHDVAIIEGADSLQDVVDLMCTGGTSASFWEQMENPFGICNVVFNNESSWIHTRKNLEHLNDRGRNPNALETIREHISRRTIERAQASKCLPVRNIRRSNANHVLAIAA